LCNNANRHQTLSQEVRVRRKRWEGATGGWLWDPIIVRVRHVTPRAIPKSAENSGFNLKVPVNPLAAHADLIATYRRAQAEAAHKQGLIKVVAAKGPKAIQAAVDTAAKAIKRRDAYAAKLAQLGVEPKD
jgi:enoyl-CoA hydratase/carnithine racemase